MSSRLTETLLAATREAELQLASDERRDVELTEAERWARDPLGWIDEHVWIASPFGTGIGRKLRPVRMRQFPDQRATAAAWVDLDHLERTGELVFRNVAIDKSRQIGETWEFAALIAWALHHHSVTGLAMHTVGRKIDDGGERNTTESLFGRIRYIDVRLDRKRLPYLAPTLKFRPFSREPAKVENPRTGGVCYGEGQTDNPGRGSTFDFELVDEAAFVEHGEKVYGALDEACPDGKALLSTPNGDDNMHARIVDEQPAGWGYLRLHWSGHPVYSQGLHVAGDDPDCQLCAGNRAGLVWDPREPRAHRFPGKVTSPWYDKRVIGKTLEQVANELDIDREGALAARVYREFQSALHVVDDGIPYDPLLEMELAADYGLDATSVLFLQDAPGEVRVIGLVEMGDLFGTTATPETVTEELRRYAVETLGVEQRYSTNEWTLQWRGIGDPSGHAKDLSTGRPLVLAYRRLGFNFGRPPTRLSRTVDPSITAVKRLLLGTPKPIRICGINADALGRHLRNNTRETDAVGAPRIGSRGAAPLRDDIHNHACRALAYWAVTRFPPIADRYETASGPAEQLETPPEEPLTRRRRARASEAAPQTLRYGSRF